MRVVTAFIADIYPKNGKGRSQILVIPTRERSETGGICCLRCESNSQQKKPPNFSDWPLFDAANDRSLP
jgi:hypothetical protein